MNPKTAFFSLSPRMFTGLAVFLASILGQNLTLDEQNSLANFLMLLGQTLATNAAQRQVQSSGPVPGLPDCGPVSGRPDCATALGNNTMAG